MIVDAYSNDAKPRYETTMRNLDAKREQKPFIPFDYHDDVVRSREECYGCVKSITKAVAKEHEYNTVIAVTQDKPHLYTQA